MLTQRGAYSDFEGRAVEDMTPTEELELEVTGVLDDDEEQETLSLGLHVESKAAALVQSHDVLAKMGLLDDVDVDADRENLPLEAHSQQRAPGALHHQGAAQYDDGNDNGEATHS